MPLPGASSSFGFNRRRPASVAVCTNIPHPKVIPTENKKFSFNSKLPSEFYKSQENYISAMHESKVYSDCNMHKFSTQTEVNNKYVKLKPTMHSKSADSNNLRFINTVSTVASNGNKVKESQATSHGHVPKCSTNNVKYSGQVVNRFGFRGVVKAAKRTNEECCEIKSVIKNNDTFEKCESKIPTNGVKTDPKQNPRTASHLPRPQISTQYLRKVPIKSVKTVTNNIVKQQPMSLEKPGQNRSFVLKENFDNIVIESVNVITNQSGKKLNSLKVVKNMNNNDTKNDVHCRKSLTTNRHANGNSEISLNTGFSSDEDDVTECSEMDEKGSKSKDASFTKQKLGSLPENDAGEILGRGEDLAMDELGAEDNSLNHQLRDVLLALEDTTFAPLAILSMPEAGVHIEDESFPDFSLRSPRKTKLPLELSTIEDKDIELSGSPGTQSNLSNSISSDGKDYFDDEISDQPGFSFYDTNPDKYLQNLVNDTSSCNSVNISKKFDAELLLTNVKEKEVRVSCTYDDDLSTYDSITSDDLMMNYEPEDITVPISPEAHLNGTTSSVILDDFETQSVGNNISTISSISDTNPHVMIQDIKLKLHELFDVLSVENTQTIDKLEENAGGYVIVKNCIKN